jgi:hypothetical protein
MTPFDGILIATAVLAALALWLGVPETVAWPSAAAGATAAFCDLL